MTIDDPALPAVRELTGPLAAEVLRPAVTAAGGLLHHASCVHLHYVPGRELVVRYDCDITWGRLRTRDTLLAATAGKAHLPGTLAITAETANATLHASVWRWPFDPVVRGLSIATAPPLLADRVGRIMTGPLSVEVVAYRPTERAVVRVTDGTGRTCYLKVLPPSQVGPVAAKHHLLAAAGVPVPEVLLADETDGLLLLDALTGATLRDRIRSGHPVRLDPSDLIRLLDRLSDVAPAAAPGPARAPRTRDAVAHAGLLAMLVPEHRPLLHSLGEAFEQADAEVERRSGAVVHGDLHESQLIVDDTGAVTGLLDLDDLGPGDPLDDPAVLLGHLEYRVVAMADHSQDTAHLERCIAAVREHLSAIHGTGPLDLTVAAVLVGLATGPFRVQAPRWRALTAAVLSVAQRYATGGSRPEATTVHS